MVNYLHISLGKQKEIVPGPWHDLVGVGCHAVLKTVLLFCLNILLMLHMGLPWLGYSSHCGVFFFFYSCPIVVTQQ